MPKVYITAIHRPVATVQRDYIDKFSSTISTLTPQSPHFTVFEQLPMVVINSRPLTETKLHDIKGHKCCVQMRLAE
jgi:hypothetical protein